MLCGLGFALVAAAQSPAEVEGAQGTIEASEQDAVVTSEPVVGGSVTSSDAAPSGFAAKREGDLLVFYFGPFGEIVGAGAALGIGAYVQRDTIVELDATVSISSWPESTEWVSAAIGVRHFLGDSFYVRGAVRDRLTGSSVTTSFLADGPYWSLHTERFVHYIGPDVSVGNRAQWGPLTIGIDWIGVHLPVLEVESIDEEARDRQSAVVSRSSETNVAATLSKIQVRLLHLQFGLSF